MFDERGDLVSAIEEKEVQFGRVWEKTLRVPRKNCSFAVTQFTIRTIRSTFAPVKTCYPFLVGYWARVFRTV